MKWAYVGIIVAVAISIIPSAGNLLSKDNEAINEVIVIGAGISGISATDALTQMGYNSLALEAKDRVGGRLWTVPWVSPDNKTKYYLDMGASWIHGVKYNPIFTLAEKYDINYTFTILESNDKSHMFYINGVPLTSDQTKYVDKKYKDFLNYLFNYYGYASFHPFQELTVDRIFAYNAKKDLSIEDALEQYFIDRGITDDTKDKFLTEVTGTDVYTKALFRHISTYQFVNTWATDINNISAVHYDIEYAMEGREAIFPEGYDQITKRLAQEIDYRLNHTVTKIDWSKQPIEVYVKGHDKPFKAKYVISTLPLGVLKKSVDEKNKGKEGYVEFYPRLPSWKVDAINKIEMGTMNKMQLIFNQTFWKDDLSIQYISIMDENPKFSFVMNIQESLGVPILLVFHSGELGKRYDKMWNEGNYTGIRDEAIESLSAIYDKANTGIVKKSFQDMIVSDWSLDPYTEGSYSYPTVGSTPSDFYDLQREVDGRLFFAGEATEALHWGRVHGAYLSGIRAAEDINFRYSWDRWYSQGVYYISGIAIALGSIWVDFINWRRDRAIALQVMDRATHVPWLGTILVIATVIIIAGVYFWLEMIVGVVPDIFDYLAADDEDCYPISRLADVIPYMRLTPQEEWVYYDQLERCSNLG